LRLGIKDFLQIIHIVS